MIEFDIVYLNIRLRVICDLYIENLIKEHFMGHAFFQDTIGEATYNLVIGDKVCNFNGNHYKMVDKWFDNATLDCYIDNINKFCYATNFSASSTNYKNLLIQYFVANLFNRLLEIYGYIGIHSSCVEQEGKGVLFVGERNSGKTVCMLNLMSDGFNSVTNDKIALNCKKDKVIGYGIAQSVSIRLSPQFCLCPENKKYVDLAIRRGIDIKNTNMLDGNNIILSENELALLNNVSQSFDTKIECIIKPNYTPNISHIIFDEMDIKESQRLIESQYMSLVHETTNFLRDIKIYGVVPESNIDYLYKVPFFNCYQNENTKEDFNKKIRSLILK